MRMTFEELKRKPALAVTEINAGRVVELTYHGTPWARLVPTAVAAATDTKVEAYVEKFTPGKTPTPPGRPSTKTDLDRYLASLPPPKVKVPGKPGNYSIGESFEYGLLSVEHVAERYGAEIAKTYIRHLWPAHVNKLPGVAIAPTNPASTQPATPKTTVYIDGDPVQMTEADAKMYRETGMPPLNLPMYAPDK